MAKGIIIHVTVGNEKRTEFFSEARIRLGADDSHELQIHTPRVKSESVWVQLERDGEVYRITQFDEKIGLLLNNEPMKRYKSVGDGDVIDVDGKDISFSFFKLEAKSALITTNRDTHVAPFIEEAAIEAATSPKRDDAKAFLREFARELLREISWTTKILIFLLTAGTIAGIFWLGASVNSELRRNREQSEQQAQIIQRLEQQLTQTSEQVGSLDKTSKDIIKTVSLAPNLSVEYGKGVCLIVGVYDLVSRQNGKQLRYPDPTIYQPDPYEPMEGEESGTPPQQQIGLTTEGNGPPVEYDFIGTGFHVGNGYILTNRHVVQPWEEDDLVKQMLNQAKGKARVKRLVVYFPDLPNPITLRLQQVDSREDLAVGTIPANEVSPDIPVLPIDNSKEAVAIGKTVVSIGYPNGPDRLLAMLDDSEARSLNSRFGNSRQALLNFLAQSRKIQPLTTQGSITDLDSRRVVHDAKTAEGGSGAPLFGQSGKVIGVNFGVFTENTASNMAVPIRFAVELLKRAGWKSLEEIETEKNQAVQTASANTNTSTQAKPE